MTYTVLDLLFASLLAGVAGFTLGGLAREEFDLQGNQAEEFYRTGLARCLWRKQKPKGPQKVEEES